MRTFKNVRQVYKGEIEEKLLSKSLQPLNEAIMNIFENNVKHYFHNNCLKLCKPKINNNKHQIMIVIFHITTNTDI